MVGNALILRAGGSGSLGLRLGKGCWWCAAREEESYNQAWRDAFGEEAGWTCV